jgi:hypothetical protein
MPRANLRGGNCGQKTVTGRRNQSEGWIHSVVLRGPMCRFDVVRKPECRRTCTFARQSPEESCLNASARIAWTVASSIWECQSSPWRVVVLASPISGFGEKKQVPQLPSRSANSARAPSRNSLEETPLINSYTLPNRVRESLNNPHVDRNNREQ